MTEMVTLISDDVESVIAWRNVLDEYGFGIRHCTLEELAYIPTNAPTIIDGTCATFAEDDILAAVGYARAIGAIACVHVPENGALAEIDDLLNEMCSGCIVRSDEEMSHFASALARRVDLGRDQRFEFVTLSPREGELLAIFGNGHSTLLKRPLCSQDPGSDIVAIEMNEAATSVCVAFSCDTEITLTVEDFMPAGIPFESNLDSTRLGGRLKELRVAAGLTQAELARRTGIHRPNIARVEAGRHTPSLETVARIASAIGVSTTRVFAPA